MSQDGLLSFRNMINNSPALQSEFLKAAESGPAGIAALGQEKGCDFTDVELFNFLAATPETELTPVEQKAITVFAERDGELSDAELELASAGGAPTCVTTTASTNRPN